MHVARLEIEIALALLPAASLKFVAWLYLELKNILTKLCFLGRTIYYAWLEMTW